MNTNRLPRIGITGITGTLGARLSMLLLSRGHKVVGLVRSQQTDSDNKFDYEVVLGEIGNKEVLITFVQKVDVIIHLAAHVGEGSKADYYNVNVNGLKNLATTMSEYNPACRLVNCSSIAALRIPGWMPWIASQYARSKAIADRWLSQFSQNYGLPVTTVYPGLIYGPGDQKFVPAVIEYLKASKLVLVSGGERHAPLIYIDDLCELFYLTAIKPQAAGQTFIGVGNNAMGIHRFFNLIAEATGTKPPVKKYRKVLLMPLAIASELIFGFFKKPSPISRRIVDILSINFKPRSEKANALIGWIPVTSPGRGLARYLDQASQ